MDKHRGRPMFEVLSHQTDSNGKKLSRCTEIIPFIEFVSANQVDDNTCSHFIENDGSNTIQEVCHHPVGIPPHSTRSYITHMERTFDRDTTHTINKLFNQELINILCKKKKQGLFMRISQRSKVNSKVIGRKSVYKSVIIVL